MNVQLTGGGWNHAIRTWTCSITPTHPPLETYRGEFEYSHCHRVRFLMRLELFLIQNKWVTYKIIKIVESSRIHVGTDGVRLPKKSHPCRASLEGGVGSDAIRS